MIDPDNLIVERDRSLPLYSAQKWIPEGYIALTPHAYRGALRATLPVGQVRAHSRRFTGYYLVYRLEDTEKTYTRRVWREKGRRVLPAALPTYIGGFNSNGEYYDTEYFAESDTIASS